MLFNTLIPALFFNVTVFLPVNIGPSATGSTLSYADVVTGSLISEPGFAPAVNGTAISGGDYITLDPPSPFSPETPAPVLRLHIDTLVKTHDNPATYIRMRATGVEIATPAVLAVISGDRNASVVKFGDFQAVSTWSFETGSERYWELQNGVFVASTSIRPGPEEGTMIVGFKIAKVLSALTDVGV